MNKPESRPGGSGRGNAGRSALRAGPADPTPVSPDPPTATPRLVRWFARRGWVHLLLLTLSALVLFPFVWLLSVSVQTDEEMAEARILPHIPTARDASPYVRPAPALERPGDVPQAEWTDGVAVMRAHARALTARRTGEMLVDAPGVDAADWAEQAAEALVARAVARTPDAAWRDPELVAAATAGAMDEAAVSAAVDGRLARLEIVGLQLRTLDAHIHELPSGPGALAAWSVESGAAALEGVRDACRLAYDFSADASPLVLRCAFPVPAGVRPEDLHKLVLNLRADDSWHRLHAELDLGGMRWRSERTSWLAQHRPLSLVFQPPTFDDRTMRARTWVPLAAAGAGGTGPGEAVLRITITRSPTLVAIGGKLMRNYLRAFRQVPFWRYVANSLMLVVLSMGGALFSSAFVAYAFARLEWPGRSAAFLLLLATMMLPSQVTMIPSFLIWRELGWYNTLNPMWVPAWFGNAFFIFLMVQQMKTIPKELEEAARIDGLNALQIWWYVIVPLVKPTLAAIAIMTFMGAWNDFMGPLVYLRDQERFPLSLGLFGMRVDAGADWTVLMAGNVMMTLPAIVVFALFQRWFIQGIASTGVKG